MHDIHTSPGAPRRFTPTPQAGAPTSGLIVRGVTEEAEWQGLLPPSSSSPPSPRGIGGRTYVADLISGLFGRGVFIGMREPQWQPEIVLMHYHRALSTALCSSLKSSGDF